MSPDTQNRCRCRLLPPALSTACLLLVCSALRAPAQPPDDSRTVVVKVHDVTGASIPADVRIFPNAVPLTASDGNYAFRVKTGPHDLFVYSEGFRDITQRIEVSAPEPTVIDLKLKLWSCSQCLPPDPWDQTVVVGVSLGHFANIALRAEDLRALKRYPVLVENPRTKAKQEYAGFSLAELLRSFCGPSDCAPNQSAALPTYVAVKGSGNRIMTPLSKLTSAQPQQRLIIADSMGGKPLLNHQLQVFLLENGQVIETAEGIIGLSLTRPR